MELIVQCVTIVWLAASGPVEVYEVFLDADHYAYTVDERPEREDFCVPDDGEGHTFTVVAKGGGKTGPFSDTSDPIEYVGSCDIDGDHICGHSDWFILAEQMDNLRRRFGQCDNGTWVLDDCPED